MGAEVLVPKLRLGAGSPKLCFVVLCQTKEAELPDVRAQAELGHEE